MSVLFSDSDSNSSLEQAPVFARVLPDSPTPYTDATQVTPASLELHHPIVPWHQNQPMLCHDKPCNTMHPPCQRL